MKKMFLKRVLLILIVSNVSHSVFSMKRKREFTLQEAALEVAEQKIRDDVRNRRQKLQNQIELELGEVPREYWAQLIDRYIENLGSIENLKNDERLGIYLELVPDYSISYEKLFGIFGFPFRRYVYMDSVSGRIFNLACVIENIEELRVAIDLPISFYARGDICALVIKGNISQRQLQNCFESFFGNNNYLEHIIINNTNIRTIPDSIKNIPGLSILTIEGNNDLIDIPDSISQISRLYSIKITDNALLTKIPVSIESLLYQNLYELIVNENIVSQEIKVAHSIPELNGERQGEIIRLIGIRQPSEMYNIIIPQEEFSSKIFFVDLKDRFKDDRAKLNKYIDLRKVKYPDEYKYAQKEPNPQKNNQANAFFTSEGFRLEVSDLLKITNAPVSFLDKKVRGVKTEAYFEVLRSNYIVEVKIYGDISFEQVQIILKENPNIWFLDIVNTSLERLPEELGSLKNLKELRIVNNKNLVELPSSFENLVYEDIEKIEIDKKTFDLVPKYLHKYFTKLKLSTGEFELKVANPLKKIEKVIEKDDLEEIRQAVTQNFNQLNNDRNSILKIIQDYAQSFFESEDKNYSFGKKFTKNLTNDLLWQVYVEKLVELNGTVDVFANITGLHGHYNDDEEKKYEIVIDSKLLHKVAAEKEDFLLEFFQPRGMQQKFDISNYIDLYTKLNLDEEHYDDVKLNIETFRSSPDVDMTSEFIGLYLDVIDRDNPGLLEKIKYFIIPKSETRRQPFGSFEDRSTFILDDLPEDILALENLEVLVISGMIFENNKLPEVISGLKNLKKIKWFYYGKHLNIDPIPDFVFEMPNLKEIDVSEKIFGYLSDEFKAKLIRFELLEDEDGDSYYKLTLK